MCCFTGAIQRVAKTRIFARAAAGNRQLLAYSMYVEMKSELAMVLPLPAPARSAEDAMRFISLKDYPDFFADCQKGWPQPAANTRNMPPGFVGAAPPKKLAVVQVGNFEASFVPGVADFARLDERFRLPAGSWSELGNYADWGFAVFKLKPGSQTIHPMAFEFPTRSPERLFFPTVHIHDGKVHKSAGFDHALYCQAAGGPHAGWAPSYAEAKRFMKVEKSAGLVDGDKPLLLRTMVGRLKNEDTWLA